MKYELYYVLNGLVNGEKGMIATSAGSGDDLQADGHYYLLEGETDGVGPFTSVDDAREYADRFPVVEYWAFPISGVLPPAKISRPDDANMLDCNVAQVSYTLGGGPYTFKIEGSYETLALTLSARDSLSAALVYQQTLRAQAEVM